MRIIICGDRYWRDTGIIEKYIKALPKDTVVIQGICRGADLIARHHALNQGLTVQDFRAEWELFGRGAGPMRNRRMLEEGKPDLVVAFHDYIDQSKGTKDMLKQAKEHGIPTELHTSR